MRQYHILYPNTSISEVEEYFEKYKRDVVIKANEGSYGNSMYYVNDFLELQEKMNLLFQKHSSISISPFYDILCEYRVIVLDDEVLLIYGKRRAEVLGDGIHTTYELLCQFNQPFFEKIEDHSSLDYILEKDKRYCYSSQHKIGRAHV